MSISEGQMPKSIIDIINDEKNLFNKEVSITEYNKIQSEPPLNNPLHWFKVKDVICVFVDMIGSTKLSATKRASTTARIYRLFTQTAVRIFDEMGAPYIDIKGDGVFALFNYDQAYRALVSAVHFKTFVETEFHNLIKNIVNEDEKDIGAHIGIDQKTIMVRRFGFKMINRKDRQNEVWAGKTVNMSAKLAGLSKKEQLIVSDRFFKNIKSDYARYCCTCSEKSEIWKEVWINDPKFDFNKYYILETVWCTIHGEEYAKELLKLD